MADDQSSGAAPEAQVFEVTINEDGRVVIPKAVRELMGVDGQKATLKLTATRTDVSLRSPIQGLRRAQEIVAAQIDLPDGVTAADLIREGRNDDIAATEAKWRRIYGDDR